MRADFGVYEDAEGEPDGFDGDFFGHVADRFRGPFEGGSQHCGGFPAELLQLLVAYFLGLVEGLLHGGVQAGFLWFLRVLFFRSQDAAPVVQLEEEALVGLLLGGRFRVGGFPGAVAHGLGVGPEPGLQLGPLGFQGREVLRFVCFCGVFRRQGGVAGVPGGEIPDRAFELSDDAVQGRFGDVLDFRQHLLDVVHVDLDTAQVCQQRVRLESGRVVHGLGEHLLEDPDLDEVDVCGGGHEFVAGVRGQFQVSWLGPARDVLVWKVLEQ